MDSTRHGTLSLLAAVDAAAMLTCIYTNLPATPRAMAWSYGVRSDRVIRDRKRRLSD
jgi:hypothetical protein